MYPNVSIGPFIMSPSASKKRIHTYPNISMSLHIFKNCIRIQWHWYMYFLWTKSAGWTIFWKNFQSSEDKKENIHSQHGKENMHLQTISRRWTTMHPCFGCNKQTIMGSIRVLLRILQEWHPERNLCRSSSTNFNKWQYCNSRRNNAISCQEANKKT